MNQQEINNMKITIQDKNNIPIEQLKIISAKIEAIQCLLDTMKNDAEETEEAILRILVAACPSDDYDNIVEKQTKIINNKIKFIKDLSIEISKLINEDINYAE